ncbi:MAG: hypothetical protein LBO63_07840, partial [Oscillospiraceae bacterium]|nr:hypothetical protein [Oscillospiraceae bacterium]
ALLCACAAGGYFFRFAGKSNQKGATSLEEAIFFLYGNCSGNNGVMCLSPLRIAVVGANASAPPHTGAKPVAALATRVSLQPTANCLRVPTGLDCGLPHRACAVSCGEVVRRLLPQVPRWSPARFSAGSSVHCVL